MFVSRSLANPAPPTTVTSPDGKLTASLRHGGAFLKADFGSYKPEKLLATNYYPDPSHEYGLAPHFATPSTGTGTLELDPTMHHGETGQSIKITNTTPWAAQAQNLWPNPYYTSTAKWSIDGTGQTLSAGDVYQGRPTLRVTATAAPVRLSARNLLSDTTTFPNLQAGKTYWLTCDVYVSADAVGNTITMLARDDPNNDSLAADITVLTSSTNVKGGWVRFGAKITVHAGRTITGIYFRAASGTQPNGAYAQIGRVIITEVPQPIADPALLTIPATDRVVVSDNFQRSDRPIAGDTAPTGQVYTRGGTHVINLVSNKVDFSPVVNAKADIVYVDCVDSPTAIAAQVSLIDGTDGDNPTAPNYDAVIGACVKGFGSGSVQLYLTRHNWALFVVPYPIPVTGYPNLASGTFDTPLAEGDDVLHQVELHYATDGTITVKLPGVSSDGHAQAAGSDGNLATVVWSGDHGTVKHPDFITYWGSKFGIQGRNRMPGETSEQAGYVRFGSIEATVSATSLAYFDGDTTDPSGKLTYTWSGAAGSSISNKLTKALFNVLDLRVFDMTPAKMNLEAGDQVVYSGWAYIPTGVTASVGPQLRIGGTGITPANSEIPDERDTWVHLSVTTTVTDPAGNITVGFYGGFASGDVVWYDDFGVSTLVIDFSGDSAALGDVHYRWVGTPGSSYSEQYNPELAWNPSVIQGPITKQGGVYTYAGQNITGQLDFTFDGNTPADENFRYGWQDDAHTIAVAEPLNPIKAARFARNGDLDTGLLVRSGNDAPAPDGIAYAYDFEAPLGQASTWVVYPVFADGTWDEPTMSVTLTLDSPTGCSDTWIKSTASPELSQLVFITADTVPQFTYASDNQLDYPQGSAFPVGTYGAHRAATTTLTAYTETSVDEAAMRELLVSTGELLFQTDPKYGIEDFYFVVGDIAMQLVWVDELHLQARQWTIPITVTARPDPTGAPLVIPGEAYDDQPDVTYDQQTALDQTYSEQTEAILAVVA